MSINPLIPASNFQISSKIESISQLGEGNIHETFIVKTKGDDSFDYLLQHKNQKVFRDVPAMMANISRVSRHIKKKVESKGLDPLRHTLTLVPANDNKLYYLDDEGEYWAMCLYISDSVTYRIPANVAQAYAGGRGTGNFHYMLSDFKEPLTDILQGFHNMRFRFEQWDALVNNLASCFKSRYHREIDWIESRREEMMNFRMLFENGDIPIRVAHNDAKLLNVLFDRNDEVLCLIDLDTVLYGSVLYDFGDAIRSYTNAGEEDDRDPGNVKMKMDYFEAYTQGYLSEASAFIGKTEIESLSFAARYITFEQLLRFLMDYLDGNKYYRIAYPEHNMHRARAQFALLLDMEKNYDAMIRTIDIIHKNIKNKNQG